MAKIVLSLDGEILQEVMLSKDRITIGRRLHNDLVIDSSAISAEHAVIVTILGDAFLEDLNSTNGTRVNGHVIKKNFFLKNNDVIELAKYKVRFIDSELDKNDETANAGASLNTDASTISNCGNTIDTTEAQGIRNHKDGNTVLQAVPDANSCAVIKILNGANAGKVIALTKPLTTIGKPGLQVAVVTRRGHVHSLTHVEGAIYPLVNGKSIGASAYALTSGDVIELSETQMAFSSP